MPLKNCTPSTRQLSAECRYRGMSDALDAVESHATRERGETMPPALTPIR